MAEIIHAVTITPLRLTNMVNLKEVIIAVFFVTVVVTVVVTIIGIYSQWEIKNNDYMMLQSLQSRVKHPSVDEAIKEAMQDGKITNYEFDRIVDLSFKLDTINFKNAHKVTK